MDTTDLPSNFFQREKTTHTTIKDTTAAYKLEIDIRSHGSKGDFEPLRKCAYNACILFEFSPHKAPLDEVNTTGHTPLTFKELVPDESDRVNLLCALNFNPTRDMIINCAIDHPDTAGPLLRAVASSTLDANIRANALALWANIAVDNDRISWAKHALEEADATMPIHNLTNLMSHVLNTSDTQSYMRSVRSGCEATWQKYTA